MAKPTTFMPEGYHTVTPFVIVKGAAGFIDYLKRAFGGVEMGRVGEDGAIGHAEVRIGDSVVMMFDSKQDWPSTPSFLRGTSRTPMRPGARRSRRVGPRSQSPGRCRGATGWQGSATRSATCGGS